MSNTAFTTLDLPQAMLDNLNNLAYTSMTPIQALALPKALSGKDLIAQAKTGSGKTLTFGLPLLLALNPRDFSTQALVICPTRELCTQVATELRKLARFQANIKIVILCGGQSIGPQIGSLEHGAHVVVGTPGRLADHLKKATLDLGRVKHLVLDEADRMLEMGFLDAVEGIIKHTPKSRQTLFFSATFAKDILDLSTKFQVEPEHLNVESQHDSSTIVQKFYNVSDIDKTAALDTALRAHQINLAVIFCNTKVTVNEVNEFLLAQGYVSCALHGDMEQRDRDQTLIQFKHSSCQFLVATDVAARGLDIVDLPAVINYDLPRETDIYTHRIGRTGRAGKSGLALSLVAKRERYKFEIVASLQRDLDAGLTDIGTLRAGNKSIVPPPMVTLCIGGGRKEKVRAGDILGALTGDAGINGSAVGKIDILDYVAFVAIERKSASKALGRLINGKIKGRKFKVRTL
ncbi:MAG: ATP-independent RNA helicase DbpA [Lentisphaeria bacterium]|jgi:ATP-independent RNA helicase DbpA